MNYNTSRRPVLKGLVASAIAIGFNVSERSWVTSASATSIFERLPTLDGVVYTDDATLANASVDFGDIVHRQPIAVLKPGSTNDIVKIIQFARNQGQLTILLKLFNLLVGIKSKLQHAVKVILLTVSHK